MTQRRLRIDLSTDRGFESLRQLVNQARLGGKRIEVEVVEQERSGQQNKSLHVFCQQLADALNASGLDMRIVLAHHAEIPWTMHSVKERIWKPVQEASTGHESTTKPSTKDYPEIYETINRHFTQTHGVHVPWPCRDTQMAEALPEWRD